LNILDAVQIMDGASSRWVFGGTQQSENWWPVLCVGTRDRPRRHESCALRFSPTFCPTTQLTCESHVIIFNCSASDVRNLASVRSNSGLCPNSFKWHSCQLDFFFFFFVLERDT
jgi:hypothetical protein